MFRPVQGEGERMKFKDPNEAQPCNWWVFLLDNITRQELTGWLWQGEIPPSPDDLPNGAPHLAHWDFEADEIRLRPHAGATTLHDAKEMARALNLTAPGVFFDYRVIPCGEVES